MKSEWIGLEKKNKVESLCNSFLGEVMHFKSGNFLRLLLNEQATFSYPFTLVGAQADFFFHFIYVKTSAKNR